MGREGPETKLVNKMREAAKAKYGDRIVMVKHHGSEYARAGVSDLLCCLNGAFVAVEVKAPESYPVKGKPSVERAVAEGPTVKQRLFVGHVKTAGGYGGFAASVEGFLSILDAVDFVTRDVSKPEPEPEPDEEWEHDDDAYLDWFEEE